MSSHLNVCWTDLKFTPSSVRHRSRAEAIQAFADGLPAVKQAGAPAFIFVHSSELVEKDAGSSRRAPKPDEPTKQRKDSEDAWAELFYRPGDYSVFVPGRFFSVFQVDTAYVTPEQDPCFNSRAAPMLLLTRKDGTVAASFEGKVRIKATAVVRAMCDILVKDGCVKGLAELGRINALMAGLEDASLAAFEVEERVAELRAKVRECEADDASLAQRTGKPRKDSAATLAARKSLAKLEEALREREDGKAEILRQEYALLQDVGLPAARMPKAPPTP